MESSETLFEWSTSFKKYKNSHINARYNFVLISIFLNVWMFVIISGLSRVSFYLIMQKSIKYTTIKYKYQNFSAETLSFWSYCSISIIHILSKIKFWLLCHFHIYKLKCLTSNILFLQFILKLLNAIISIKSSCFNTRQKF